MSQKLEVTMKNIKFHIYTVYRPPQGCTNSFFQKLEEMLNTHNNLIIAGDLNINKFKSDRTSTDLLDIIESSGALITNQAVTRNSSKTLIDYFIIKKFPIKCFSCHIYFYTSIVI